MKNVLAVCRDIFLGDGGHRSGMQECYYEHIGVVEWGEGVKRNY